MASVITVTTMTTYTVVDGQDHRFDDPGEALRTLVFLYRRFLRLALQDALRRLRRG